MGFLMGLSLPTDHMARRWSRTQIINLIADMEMNCEVGNNMYSKFTMAGLFNKGHSTGNDHLIHCKLNTTHYKKGLCSH
jgi:hypothetical protein